MWIPPRTVYSRFCLPLVPLQCLQIILCSFLIAMQLFLKNHNQGLVLLSEEMFVLEQYKLFLHYQKQNYENNCFMVDSILKLIWKIALKSVSIGFPLLIDCFLSKFYFEYFLKILKESITIEKILFICFHLLSKANEYLYS